MFALTCTHFPVACYRVRTCVKGIKGNIIKYAKLLRKISEQISTVTMTASIPVSVRQVGPCECVIGDIQYSTIQPATSEWKMSTLKDAL